MNKKVLFSAALLAASSQAFAGGLLTNTNLNAATLRMLSQQANIDITGLYYNPAGSAFLNEGWHLSLNIQNAAQSRDITTTFPLFALNKNNLAATHKFEGTAKAPVIPSFQLAYNKDKWSFSASFGINGGGGKCEFEQGLGSFEALYAGTMYQGVKTMLPAMVAEGLQQAGIPAPYVEQLVETGTYNSQLTGYSMDAYMRGRQYYFGLQLGAAYKLTDTFSAYAGVRFMFADCNYYGYVQDVKADYAYDYNVPANAQLRFPGKADKGTGTKDLNDNTLALNANQSGFGVTPIIGIDWHPNQKWNFAAKYEFMTSMKLKNDSEMNDFAKGQIKGGNETLAQFEDGTKISANIPSILTLGAQYKPVEQVSINAGFNKYWDRQATAYGNKNEAINSGSTEFTAGLEVDVTKWLTLSGSWQNTNYDLSDAYMNDLSFNLSSNSLGVGFRIKATERCSIDFGYMQTFYKDKEVTTQTAAGPKTDLYQRTNRVFGLGVNLAF